jgi:hypothetical protein
VAKTVSVAAYGRMCTKGLFIALPDAACSGWYRRTKTKIQYWSSDKTWLLSTHQDLACAALTAAGWPPDLEPESIAGLYAPAPLEGHWTRLYWRTVETVVLWTRRTQWLFTGRTSAVQHRALAGR